MRQIEYLFGPFDKNEIDFYKKRLRSDNGEIINSFQKQLIFDLFYKYFGDPITIHAINKDDYVKLLIAAKNLLIANNMVVLPYIISSKVERLNARKCINKKELIKLESSEYYKQIRAKYNNEKIEKHILSIIATILASEFRIISYDNKDIDGKMVTNISDIINEEVMMMVTLI